MLASAHKIAISAAFVLLTAWLLISSWHSAPPLDPAMQKQNVQKADGKMQEDTMSIWVGAVSGGLAGAILTLLGQSVKTWRNRPILSATFRASEQGCEVETPASLINTNTGELIAKCQQKYVRLRIGNHGRSFAKNVSVSVTGISHTAPGAGAATFAEEVFELALSLGGGKTVFNLPAGGHRFVDLVHTEVCTPAQGKTLPPDRIPQTGCLARRHFDFATSAVRLEDLGFVRGRYRMSVFVSAENAASLRDEFEFSWDGSLNGLRIET